jgi:O-acetyl-ADP-ribose deacetylase (regulator of RNase III)
VWGEGDEDQKLSEAVTGSLLAADRLELASIAMPAISTGIFGFPKEHAAGVILSAIERFFGDKPESTVNLVQMFLYDQPTLEAFTKIWREKGWGK